MNNREIIRPSRELVDPFWDISVASISTFLRSQGILRHAMLGPKALTPGMKAVGTAVTLQFLPKREDIIEGLGEEQTEKTSALWASIMSIEQGDVLVIDARGHMQTGCLGEMLMTGVQARGGKGIVVDGCLRDLPSALDLGLPLFAQGGTPANAGFFEMYPWDYNLPIGCGGVLIFPGDIIVADDDGAVVMPPKMAKKVIEWCQPKEDREIFEKMKIRETGNVAKYHPMNEEAKQEYTEWLKQLKKSEEI